MSFARQLSQWVRRALGSELKSNINRLINRGLRQLLRDAARGPVLGSRGEAGLAITVVPEPPAEPSTEGLYGQPYPGNPHPDPGALWFESGGSWTGLIYPDWQEDFPHPPGVLAGNVFHENATTGHLVSWHWYPGTGPPGNAIKYLQDPGKFNAWARAEQQAVAPGGDLSRDILHAGKRLYRLPDHWACIGVCTADDWLFTVAFNWSGRQHNWVWSGYDVDVTGTCNAATALAVWVKSNPAAPPDTIFSVGMSVRIDGEERTIQTFLQSGGPDCWLIRLATALPAVPAAGTPIEIPKSGGSFGTYTTRVFAVATVTNVDGDLEVVPGSTLHAIADLIEIQWTQQFVAHPDGRNMMSLVYTSLVNVNRDIHRLAFDTGPTPPTVNHTIETRSEKSDQIYLDAIDEPRVVHSCSESDVPGVRRDLVLGSTGCFSCADQPGDYHVAFDAVYSGQDVQTSSFDIEDKMGRKIQDIYKSHTLAVDYDTSGNELIATLEIEYEATITTRTTNSYSNTRTFSGTLTINPYCANDPNGPVWYTNSGQYTDVRDEQSTLNAERRLQTNFSIDVSVNGQKKINLGRIQDDVTWANTSDTQTAFDVITDTYEGINWDDVVPAPTEPVCGTPPGDRTFYDQPGATQIVDSQRSQQGTLVSEFCSNVPSFNYEVYPIDPVAYDIRNVATPLLYMDLRSGVYVTQGREGIIDDIYGLVETAGNPTVSDRQIYPYTVEVANFSPSKPPVQDRGTYDQHWAAWGVDFTPEAAVGSPAPTWLVITQFDQKGPNDLTNPANINPISDFVDTDDSVEQGSAMRAGKILVNVYVELPTAGQETLQAVELRNPTGDPLGLIGIPGATKITNIGAV